ncbi:LysM peptidoglycan-binding domain-containing protein [uncultured Microbacterium sp.]|uniref:LysM peptidoglycan-binding domain-containing protein n=1 Tax=uncultured Microbacterium sp. TaxID=191216 RepID=UPI00260A8C0E|nr:LysM peptidoglycan-binding domain-containing protein [uncultured Microbacterium sp.]
MSSTSISAPVISPVRATTRLRLTARGRAVLLGLAAVPLAAVVGLVALSGGSALASGESSPATGFEMVTILPGDTLWSVAESVAPGVDPRIVIDEIQRLNVRSNGAVQVGERIAIPAQYSN